MLLPSQCRLPQKLVGCLILRFEGAVIFTVSDMKCDIPSALSLVDPAPTEGKDHLNISMPKIRKGDAYLDSRLQNQFGPLKVAELVEFFTVSQ